MQRAEVIWNRLRVALLCAVGFFLVLISGVAVLPASGHRRLLPGLLLAGGGLVLFWLGIANRPVWRPSWYATAAVGVVALVVELASGRFWPSAVATAIFWWSTAVLVIAPTDQAIRATRRARYLVDHAPTGGASREGR